MSEPLPYRGPQPDPDPGDAADVEEPKTELDQIIADPVLQWRCRQFVGAGMTLHQARKLACDNRVDVHYVLYRLIGRGCDPTLAFDIASW